jgi:hypothetical protein
MPWPIKNRELCMSIGTFLDPYNKAIYQITTSIPRGNDYLGFKTPPPAKKLLNMDVTYQCDYF